MKDHKNENTVIFIKGNIARKILNTIIKLAVWDDKKINSVITTYPIRDREVRRLLQKNIVLKNKK